MATAKGFEFRVYKSTKTLIILKCKVSTECKWSMRATTKTGSNMWRVIRYNDVHTCSDTLNHKDHPQATSRLVAELIKDKYEGPSRIYRPNDIKDDMRKIYGVSISYSKAWRSREFAYEKVRGSPEESFVLLPSYAYMLVKKNPGSVTFIERDEGNHFKYFFMALGASIHGFRTSIRHVIALDAAFLKGKYKGVMFIANGLDGNGKIFPISFGVGDAETDESWIWFISKLKIALGDVVNPAFVSDRHRSIEKAVATVYPESYHYACIFHLSQNIKSKFKHDKIHDLFFLAAKCYRVSQFNDYWKNIGTQYPDIAKYLDEVGIPRWARVYQDARRYNIMTTNIAESMNAMLLDARQLPITAFVDHIRATVQRWHYERREAATKNQRYLTPIIHKEVVSRNAASRTLTVDPCDNNTFRVRGGEIKEAVVDLNEWRCTCREFDFQQFPCAHAIAAARHVHVRIESLCHLHYTTETWRNAYAGTIVPLGNPAEWDLSEMATEPILLPPITRRQPGRRRVKRKASAGEDVLLRTCSRCLQKGHNRRTCKNPIPLHNPNNES